MRPEKSRVRCFRWRFDSDGFERDISSESCGPAARLADFAVPESVRLALRYSTVNEGVTRFNGILKIW
jgi:hypothetical protein